MVDIKQLRSLNDVFSDVMKQIFLTPFSSDPGQNDVTWAQRKILMMIEAKGPQKMSDLARQICVTMSGATAIIDKMVKQGLVTRQFDPGDRRVVLIALSDDGRSVIKDATRVQERVFEDILDRLSPEKRVELLESFTRIHSLLQELASSTEGEVASAVASGEQN